MATVAAWRSAAAGSTPSRARQPDDTYIYLDHIAARADTVDAAVEELLALVPTGVRHDRPVPAKAIE